MAVQRADHVGVEIPGHEVPLQHGRHPDQRSGVPPSERMRRRAVGGHFSLR
jgi:hypothetical protein